MRQKGVNGLVICTRKLFVHIQEVVHRSTLYISFKTNKFVQVSVDCTHFTKIFVGLVMILCVRILCVRIMMILLDSQ